MHVRRTYPDSYLREMFAAVRSDAGLYGLLAVYCGVGIVYIVLIGQFDLNYLIAMNGVYGLTSLVGYGFSFPLLLGIGGLIHILHRFNRHRRLAFGIMFDARHVGRFLAGTLLMLAMVPFRAVFNVIKISIPTDGVFLHDIALADFDRALHFGVDPFHWLFALSKSELLLRVIELNYNNFWFVVVFGALYWVAVSPRCDAIRARLVTCFVLSWAISGGIGAIVGSSAGPVYFGAVTGDVWRFAELVNFVDLSRGQLGSASDYQHYLWDIQAGHHVGLGSGISAFPSMHVAMITVLALFVSEASRKWAIAAWAYVAFTVFCSIYLGWHYAIDGYVAIGLTVATHFAVKLAMTRRWRWRHADAAEATAETAA